MNNLKLYIVCLFSLTTISCKKDWLEIKPDKSLVIPTTLKDFQGILDGANVSMSRTLNFVTLGSDEYYKRLTDWNALPEYERNVYNWQTDYLIDFSDFDNNLSTWNNMFRDVYNSNLILERISEVPRTSENSILWDNVKGGALFFRAWFYLQGVETWGQVYRKETAETDLGIPLKLSTDPKDIVPRSSVKESYNQILKDLNEALPLLPETSSYKNRPSKAAVYALLSRIYLFLENYDLSLQAAENALQLYNSLLNYNLINETQFYPFNQFNDEIIFHSNGTSYSTLSSNAFVDTFLVNSYHNDDLRSILYFQQIDAVKKLFRGSYFESGPTYSFYGLAVDEVMLTQAECYARIGSYEFAETILNNLLQTRWKSATYIPYEFSDSEDAMEKILMERRKSLLFRGIRWSDLRRLNKDPRFAVTLKRSLGNEVFELPPNDPRYAYQIPLIEVLGSGLIPNPR